ncbi:hypothetical protein COCMIDRAFT_9960 [Bipolaris oryzae ATCC 44560]|uniref:Uncharacterized protein n=1 Tax=Bipolaris oryzae ATCC 44560 TaxID=930090 RepID=W6Z8T9_COCMI|nr:uncharacterized protein COCMIDRAFT_9960 [Bipolaris oryzae ATCC 44560]EUC40106.1 hypothetical protein COCMIDRAFT_9960 [Bipolaris oryzae ATCC 44560]
MSSDPTADMSNFAPKVSPICVSDLASLYRESGRSPSPSPLREEEEEEEEEKKIVVSDGSDEDVVAPEVKTASPKTTTTTTTTASKKAHQNKAVPAKRKAPPPPFDEANKENDASASGPKLRRTGRKTALQTNEKLKNLDWSS